MGRGTGQTAVSAQHLEIHRGTMPGHWNFDAFFQPDLSGSLRRVCVFCHSDCHLTGKVNDTG